MSDEQKIHRWLTEEDLNDRLARARAEGAEYMRAEAIKACHNMIPVESTRSILVETIKYIRGPGGTP